MGINLSNPNTQKIYSVIFHKKRQIHSQLNVIEQL